MTRSCGQSVRNRDRSIAHHGQRAVGSPHFRHCNEEDKRMTSEALVEATPEATTSPDLQQRVPVSALADGGMIAGHVGEDAVVLVRKGDQFFALDAVCTHYGASLAEGAIVGETLRCPWHHACFSLRTGSAVAAPAMRPLRVFSTVRDGDVVRVQPDARVIPAQAMSRAAGREHV